MTTGVNELCPCCPGLATELDAAKEEIGKLLNFIIIVAVVTQGYHSKVKEEYIYKEVCAEIERHKKEWVNRS